MLKLKSIWTLTAALSDVSQLIFFSKHMGNLLCYTRKGLEIFCAFFFWDLSE